MHKFKWLMGIHLTVVNLTIIVCKYLFRAVLNVSIMHTRHVNIVLDNGFYATFFFLLKERK